MTGFATDVVPFFFNPQQNSAATSIIPRTMVRAANERSTAFYVFGVVWLVTVVWLVSNDLSVLAVVGSAALALWHFGLRDKFSSESDDDNSAYSVFNKGGRSILGGFTGEQLEGQLRGGTNSSNSASNSHDKVDDSQPLVTLSSSTPRKMSEKDKLRQRSAAAAAAERRMQQQQE